MIDCLTHSPARSLQLLAQIIPNKYALRRNVSIEHVSNRSTHHTNLAHRGPESRPPGPCLVAKRPKLVLTDMLSDETEPHLVKLLYTKLAHQKSQLGIA